MYPVANTSHDINTELYDPELGHGNPSSPDLYDPELGHGNPSSPDLSETKHDDSDEHGVKSVWVNLDGTDEFPRGMIARVILNVKKAGRKYKPVLRAGCKRLVFEHCCPDGTDSIGGTITASRWRRIRYQGKPFSSTMFRPKMEIRPDVFMYDVPEAGHIEFYVNFADTNLFGFYGGGLFAQDEMQAAEHPSICVFREYLGVNHHEHLQPRCRHHGRRGPVLTPWIVMGAERACSIATDENEDEGRPRGLYGNQFARASGNTIKKATSILDPPTTTNIIAMVAPSGGWGSYSMAEIEDILATAYTSFHAARVEAYIKSGYWKDNLGEMIDDTKKPTVVIHTGNWGTGAFGGNKRMMALLQMLAAIMAKVDKIVYHTVVVCRDAEWARRYLEKLFSSCKGTSLETLLKQIDSLELKWGVSNGT